jgi:hypothetical protein
MGDKSVGPEAHFRLPLARDEASGRDGNDGSEGKTSLEGEAREIQV